MLQASKALTVAVFGARGTGKTAWTIQQLDIAAPKRLMVWDFKHDPALEGIGQAFNDLPNFIRSLNAAQFQSRYLVNHGQDLQAQFEFFCRAAWQAGCVLMFVDELPEVTKANRAPPAWRRCVNIGRDYKIGQRRAWISIIGAGQRPAECDKSFIANADVIHTGRLVHLDDARELAKVIGCRAEEITKLPDLHWLERRAGQVDALRGCLNFAKKVAAPKNQKKAS